VVAELGGIPQWIPSPFVAKSTPENLTAAVGGEVYTSDECIPGFCGTCVLEDPSPH
jgi:hypothetical protein